MDARPQKPVRGFRVHGDENSQAPLPVVKTLHSRNKSSPALSSMATTGMSKILSKRAAFGDVSNTAYSGRSVRDDSALPGKSSSYDSKENDSTQPKNSVVATAAFLRPAQRPLAAASGIKSVAGLPHPASNGLMAKPAADPTHQHHPTANVRKPLINRSTTVFRDYSTEQQPQKHSAQPPSSSIPVASELSSHQATLSKVDEKPQHHPIRKIQSSTSVSAARVEPFGQILMAPKVTSVAILDGKTENQGTKLSYSEDPPESTTEENMLENDTQLASLMARVETSISANEAILAPSNESYYDPAATAKSRVDEADCKANTNSVTEPEEYWDEDEEENFDEEGYVTARSFRSRGENLTGNATTTLVPKTSNKVRKEIEAAKILVESMKSPEEVEDEAWDTSMVAEYGDEIFQYMRELEDKMQPNPHYMDLQTEIQWSMRSVLMDWLVQVHHRFQLLPETLFLCVNYIDRFLSYKVVSLGKLQLVGATAIFVAAKYEEINCPSVSEIVYMVDGGYTVDEILKAERFMLSMLQFELGWPGPMSFLRRISKADDYDLETRTLAKYFLELTIMDERFLGCPPSFTAAGAHCLARLMLQKGNWSPHHVYYSGYTYSQLHSLLHLMYECCEDPTKHHLAIYDKYQDKRYKCASRFVANELSKGFHIPDIQTNNAQTFMSFYDSSLWNADGRLYR